MKNTARDELSIAFRMFSVMFVHNLAAQASWHGYTVHEHYISAHNTVPEPLSCADLKCF